MSTPKDKKRERGGPPSARLPYAAPHITLTCVELESCIAASVPAGFEAVPEIKEDPSAAVRQYNQWKKL
jgi:hypothetical protein